MHHLVFLNSYSKTNLPKNLVKSHSPKIFIEDGTNGDSREGNKTREVYAIQTLERQVIQPGRLNETNVNNSSSGSAASGWNGTGNNVRTVLSVYLMLS